MHAAAHTYVNHFILGGPVANAIGCNSKGHGFAPQLRRYF